MTEIFYSTQMYAISNKIATTKSPNHQLLENQHLTVLNASVGIILDVLFPSNVIISKMSTFALHSQGMLKTIEKKGEIEEKKVIYFTNSYAMYCSSVGWFLGRVPHESTVFKHVCLTALKFFLHQLAVWKRKVILITLKE